MNVEYNANGDVPDGPIRIWTTSADETRSCAARLASAFRGGELITLSGELGAGKTSFAQGIARGIGVRRTVNSPTFTIVKEYAGERLRLYHMDAYRLEDEMEALGFEEYIGAADGVTVVEWPEQIETQLPFERLDVTINRPTGTNGRTGETYPATDCDLREIRFHAYGSRYTTLLKGV
jgi:tRNA threonylcarbamoyladenosine biosynthesis protein TsaE